MNYWVHRILHQAEIFSVICEEKVKIVGIGELNNA